MSIQIKYTPPGEVSFKKRNINEHKMKTMIIKEEETERQEDSERKLQQSELIDVVMLVLVFAYISLMLCLA